MKIDKVLFGLKTSVVLFALALASLLLQISADVGLYDEYGIHPTSDTNRFFGFALILCFTGLIVSVYTHYQY